MAISHNPIFNRAMQTGALNAQLDQQQVDSEFSRLTGTPMTIEGTAAKVLGMFAVVAIAAGATWMFDLTGLSAACDVGWSRSWTLGNFW